MLIIEVSDRNRTGKDDFEKYDITSYIKATFQMYGGEIRRVKLRVENEFAGVIFDRFGRDLIIEKNDDFFEVEVLVTLSPHFYGWILALGDKVKILSPDEAIKGMKELIEMGEKIYL